MTGDPLQLGVAGDGRGGAVALWVTSGHLESATFEWLSGWRPVETLDDGAGAGTYSSPSIAVSANGDSVVAWRAIDGRSVRARRRASGAGSWEGVAVLSGPGFVDQPPGVGMDDTGAATLTWAESQSGLWTARFLPGTGWERPRVLEPLLYAAYHAVAVSASGLVTVPYVFFPDAPRGPGPEVREPRWQTCGVHFRTSGGLMTSVDCVKPPWRAFGSEILAASGPDGRALAVWHEPQAYGGWPGRSAAWWHPVEGWSARTPLGSGSGTTLAVDGRGAGFVLVTDAEPVGLRAHRFEADRGWLPPEDLLTPSATGSFSASIALETMGSGWAAWDERHEPGDRVVIARRYVEGTGWSSAVVLTGADVSLASGPKVVVDGRGGAVIVWREGLPGGGASIVARQYVSP